MIHPGFVRALLSLKILLTMTITDASPPVSASAPTGIVLIVVDDLGIGDVGAWGATHVRTPRLDKLAGEGARLTDFHVPAAQCTPARAAMLTAQYPERIGMERVVFADSPHGIPADTLTLPEMLRERGYRTHAVGKWHLGDRVEALPTSQGFDTYRGIPYSHDMEPAVILDGTEVVARDVPAEELTRRWTDEALAVLDDVKPDDKFFLYLAHTAPHVPVGASAKFAGKSAFGAYGDTVEELDASVGEVLDRVEEIGRAENTLVMFVSDNGPFQPWAKPDPAIGGFAYPYRGAKAAAREGGLRVPFIARWPGRIPAGSVRGELAMAMDIMPTIAEVTQDISRVELPRNDGRSMWPLLRGDDTVSDRGPVAFYHYGRLESVREGPWKLTFPRKREWDWPFAYRRDREKADAMFGPGEEWLPQTLNHLERDPGETLDYSAGHEAIIAELEAFARAFRADLGDAGR
ncbi:MAG: sulfatase [Synoicihabitans sp.]